MSKTLAIAISMLAFCIGLVIGMGLMGSEIGQLKNEISHLRSQKATLEKQIEDRDERIIKLKKDVEYLESKKVTGFPLSRE